MLIKIKSLFKKITLLLTGKTRIFDSLLYGVIKEINKSTPRKVVFILKIKNFIPASYNKTNEDLETTLTYTVIAKGTMVKRMKRFKVGDFVVVKGFIKQRILTQNFYEFGPHNLKEINFSPYGKDKYFSLICVVGEHPETSHLVLKKVEEDKK